MANKKQTTTRYKVWVEIERIDIDENGNEEYSDCDFPESIAYRETYEDAEKLQTEIVQTFGEIF
jgi:hypothetical protein